MMGIAQVAASQASDPRMASRNGSRPSQTGLRSVNNLPEKSQVQLRFD